MFKSTRGTFNPITSEYPLKRRAPIHQSVSLLCGDAFKAPSIS